MWAAQDVDNIFAYNGFARFTDNFTKVLNTHALKLGGIVERQYKNQNFQHQNNIQLVFANWGAGSTGNEFADMLVGRPAEAVVGEPSAVGNFVAWNYEFYAQDSVEGRQELHPGVRPAHRQVDEQRRDQPPRRHLRSGALQPERRHLPRRREDAAQRRGVRHRDRRRPDRPAAVAHHAARELRLGPQRQRRHRRAGGRGHLLQPRAGQRPVQHHQRRAELLCVHARRRQPDQRRRRRGPDLPHARHHRSPQPARRHQPQHHEPRRPRLAADVPGERGRRPPHAVEPRVRCGLRGDVRPEPGRAEADQRRAGGNVHQRNASATRTCPSPPTVRPSRTA